MLFVNIVSKKVSTKFVIYQNKRLSTASVKWRNRAREIKEKYVHGFDEKPEGQKLFPRFNCGWEDNINLYLKEVEWTFVGWILRAQDKDH